MIISKDELKKLVKELAREEKIFLCEAQFQFELAWKLREYFEKQKKNVSIHLEYPNCKEYKKEVKTDELNSADEKHRLYYDIVLERDNIYCIIELKYKTKKEKIKYLDRAIELKDQAAQDLGRYDFLKDVYRIENFNKDNEGKILDCGYTVFLTNDKTYWEKDGEGYIYKDFALKDKREIPNDRDLKWAEGTKESSVGEKRVNGFKLNGSYQIDWQSYNDQFKYLILEIK